MHFPTLGACRVVLLFLVGGFATNEEEDPLAGKMWARRIYARRLAK